MDQNLKLKSIQSTLESERDEILVQLDYYLNNQSINVPISQITAKIKELALINQTLLTFENIVEDNKNLESQETLEMIQKLQTIQDSQSKEK